MASKDSIDAVMERMDPMLDEFDSIVRTAAQVYRSYVRLVDGKPVNDVLIEHSKRTTACAIYDHMVGECARRFLNRSDIRPIDIHGLKLWLIGERVHTVVRWKKMDEDGISRNYPTKQAEDYDKQLELPDLPSKPTRVTVGYVPDAAGDILRVQVARPHGIRQVDWCAAIIPAATRSAEQPKWEDVTMQYKLGA